MSRRGPLLLGVLLIATLLAPGCASVRRDAAYRLFAQGRYGDAAASYEAELAEGGRQTALDRNSAGLMALLDGDVERAHRHFREAFAEIDDLTATTGETIAAFAGPARSRRWKGDPYEGCMNAYYLGLTYWLRGDVDNAAASFRAGVLRDADSELGSAQSDFALLWYMLGQAQRAARHTDRGEQALAQAHRLAPDNPWLDPARASSGNVLVVLEVGMGPERVAAGPHGAWVRFRRRRYAGAGAEVTVGGRSLGRTAPVSDLFRQAVTRGDKVIDHVNQGKAVFKDVAVGAGAVVLSRADNDRERAIGAGLILLGLLAPAEADLRQWDTLPGSVHVLTAELPEGEHVIDVDVLDASGRRLPDLSRHVPVTVRPGRVALAWARALPQPQPREFVRQ